MTHPISVDEDPSVGVATAALDKLWADENLGVPPSRIEALTVLEARDRWDAEHGVQRVTENLIRSMASRISVLESALTTAVQAFEVYSGPISVGSPDDVRAPSIPVPTRTVERWRLIAEGGE